MIHKCMIVDDEELARELIATHLSHLDEFELIASCKNALEARTILQQKEVDLLFLDIEMPFLKGTEFFQSLSRKPKVIFTTAFRNYAVEGFELNAIDYLLKPILFDRFIKAIDKFLESKKLNGIKQLNRKDHIFIQSHKKNIKLKLADILYVESLKDYIKISFPEDNLIFKCGITAFEKMLDNRFLRVHRSFLVNMDKVSAFTKNDIEIEEKEIPIGESYKIDVLNKLK
ncbi:LytR/AlgR family response regulator transcription factor [Xanthovirga aplysinae]|uniref:LytR/AlgR family response regulator transcription factor n=1 Tax=Xanthovirga aplysinae TaxID=2529853 RepID=UPI0012BB95ED|nr:response regulator transcription factor [Xanthovirga aplysinae]MTI31971.1 response regulator transcription factor [Xanthovirga aplysinae]